jgi:hypothetical protein
MAKEPRARRNFIKAAAAAGAGLVLAGTENEASAAPTPPTPSTPLNMPAGKLYPAAAAKNLTKTAAKLTKAELHDMAVAGNAAIRAGKSLQQFLAGYKTKSGVKVTAADVNSLHQAYTARHNALHGKNVSVSCCCCSPCCTCAAAVTRPVVAGAA